MFVSLLFYEVIFLLPDSVVVGDLDLAYARVHQAFRCDTMTELEPQESDKGVTITMTTWDVDIEAYRDRTDQKMAFRKFIYCMVLCEPFWV